MKVAEATNDNGVIFSCPGCGMIHRIQHGGGNGPRWQFNGDYNRPTFSPSILARWTCGEANEPRVCHSFVTDGRIQFLGDCTHVLSGQTVDLPPWNDDFGK